MIGLILLGFAVVVAVAAMRLLPGARWVYRSPRLGIAAWYAVLITVVVAVGAGLTELVLPWPSGWRDWCSGQDWCNRFGGERHGPAAWIATRSIAGFALGGAMLALMRTLRSTRTLTTRRRRHRDMIRLAGREHAGLGATVIEHSQPAAYVVPGAAAVVTSAALERLGPDELAAVLAHERAHVAGGHQWLLDVVEVAARVGPRLQVLTTAVLQVRRLVEMRADEVAAASHPPLLLARALVALTAGGAGPAPAGAASATGGDTVERMHRLMCPPHRLPAGAATAIAAGLLVMPVLPVALAAACRWWPALSACLWDF